MHDFDSTYWELSSGPDFGHIEGIKAQFGRVGVFWLHDLDFGCPFLLLSPLHLLPQLLLGVVWVLARDADGFWLGELFLAMLGNKVVLDVDEFAFFVDPNRASVTWSCHRSRETYHLKVWHP